MTRLHLSWCDVLNKCIDKEKKHCMKIFIFYLPNLWPFLLGRYTLDLYRKADINSSFEQEKHQRKNHKDIEINTPPLPPKKTTTNKQTNKQTKKKKKTL